MVRCMFEHPGEISGIVGRQPQFGAVDHNVSEPVEHRWRHEPTLVVPSFRPRIREKNEDTASRPRRQRREERARIAGMDADIVELPSIDFAEQFDDAVFEDFAADKANLRVPLGLRREMLAAAKADFQPDFLRGRREQPRGIDKASFGQCE